MKAFSLLAGMQLDLFTPLKNGPMTAETLAGELGLNESKLSMLLYALVVANVLTVENGRFANTPESDRFLVQGLPTYIGGRHAGLSSRWHEAFGTAESVRTGNAQGKLEFSEMSEEDLEKFLRGINPQALFTGRILLEEYDLSSHRRMIDVGAGLGGMTQTIADSNVDLEAVLVDLPTVIPIAQRYLAEVGLDKRVTGLAADAVTDPLGGPFDLAVVKAFIQVLGPEEASLAIRNISNAMEPGGKLYVIGRVIEDSRLTPEPAVLFNVSFLNVYDGGQAYTASEYRSWLASAGFHDIEIRAVASGESIISATKSG